MGERLKKAFTSFIFTSENQYMLCYIICSQFYSSVLFPTSLVYPTPVSPCMGMHKYDSTHYLYSSMSTSLGHTEFTRTYSLGISNYKKIQKEHKILLIQKEGGYLLLLCAPEWHEIQVGDGFAPKLHSRMACQGKIARLAFNKLMWALKVISATAAAAMFALYVSDFLMPWLDCFGQIGLDNQICLEQASPVRLGQPGLFFRHIVMADCEFALFLYCCLYSDQ